MLVEGVRNNLERGGWQRTGDAWSGVDEQFIEYNCNSRNSYNSRNKGEMASLAESLP